MLSQGVDCSVEMPQNRWDVDDYYDPNASTGRLQGLFKHLDGDCSSTLIGAFFCTPGSGERHRRGSYERVLDSAKVEYQKDCHSGVDCRHDKWDKFEGTPKGKRPEPQPFTHPHVVCRFPASDVPGRYSPGLPQFAILTVSFPG